MKSHSANWLLFLLLQIYSVRVSVFSARISSSDHHFIESPKLSQWGVWGSLEHCPSDQVVVGMQLKVHHSQGIKDDTGLNAVKLYCENPYSLTAEDMVPITSLVGNSGEWQKEFKCPPNALGKTIGVGFQLRSETSSGVKDDTAGNNLRLICSDTYQREGFTVLEGDGTERGEWTSQQLCWSGYAICGLQTQVETSKSMDTTGLNNLKVRCCRLDGEGDSSHSRETGTNYPFTNGNHSLDSLEGGSSSSMSSEDSNSSTLLKSLLEKDGIKYQHQFHQSDEISVEPSSGEQELIAITENPDRIGVVFESNEDALGGNHSEISAEGSHSREIVTVITKISSSEDETLPQEIASIDQVDNSEAHHEEETSSTVAHSRKIPEEVVHALEDVDDDGHSHSEEHGSSSEEDFFPMAKDKSEESDEINNAVADNGTMRESNNEIPNPNRVLKPKSSPRFGQIETINTSSIATSKGSSQAARDFRVLGVSSMLILYLISCM